MDKKKNFKRLKTVNERILDKLEKIEKMLHEIIMNTHPAVDALTRDQICFVGESSDEEN